MNEYLTIDPDGSGSQSPVSLTHDPAGNLTLDPTARVVGDTTAPSGQLYGYDEENRLVKVCKGSGELLLQFAYGALGRRIQTTEYLDAQTGAALTSPKATRHVYAGLETIEEYVCTGSTLCQCGTPGCFGSAGETNRPRPGTTLFAATAACWCENPFSHPTHRESFPASF